MAKSSPSPAPAPREFSRADLRLGPRGQLNRLAMLLLALAYPPLIFALAGALIWAAWKLATLPLVRMFGLAAAAMMAIVALMLVFSLVMLLVRLRQPPPLGMPLRAESNPAAFELISRIARRLRVKAPTLILMLPDANAAIGTHDLRSVGGAKREHVLFLGMILVLISNAAEFAALVCHELAHAASGDTVAGRFVQRYFNAMGAALSIHDPDNPESFSLVTWVVHLPLIVYFKLFLLLYLHDSRIREHRADRVAAQVCGPQRTRDMLRKSVRVAALPELDLERLISDAGAREKPPESIFDLFRERHAAVSAERWERAENEAFMEERTVWSTHPNLADRFRRLNEIQAPELPSERPAQSLFLDWQRAEREMSAVLLGIEHARQAELEQSLRRMGS